MKWGDSNFSEIFFFGGIFCIVKPTILTYLTSMNIGVTYFFASFSLYTIMTFNWKYSKKIKIKTHELSDIHLVNHKKVVVQLYNNRGIRQKTKNAVSKLSRANLETLPKTPGHVT